MPHNNSLLQNTVAVKNTVFLLFVGFFQRLFCYLRIVGRTGQKFSFIGIYIFKIEKEKLAKAEEEISEDFNLNRDYTILNIAEYPRFEEMKTLVEFGDKLYHLSEISSIVDALNNARFNSSDLCLFVDSEDVEKVRRLKIENYLDLPETTRKYDTIHTDQVRLM